MPTSQGLVLRLKDRRWLWITPGSQDGENRSARVKSRIGESVYSTDIKVHQQGMNMSVVVWCDAS